jgi:hypothetical protein
MGVYNKHDEEYLRHALECEVGMLVDRLDAACRKPASILVAATLVGPSIGAIIKLTGYSEQDVNEVAFRMWASRMWVEGTVDYSDWGDDELGVINFLLDLSVAEGVIVRTQRIRDGKPVYMSAKYESVN